MISVLCHLLIQMYEFMLNPLKIPPLHDSYCIWKCLTTIYASKKEAELSDKEIYLSLAVAPFQNKYSKQYEIS